MDRRISKARRISKDLPLEHAGADLGEFLDVAAEMADETSTYPVGDEHPRPRRTLTMTNTTKSWTRTKAWLSRSTGGRDWWRGSAMSREIPIVELDSPQEPVGGWKPDRVVEYYGYDGLSLFGVTLQDGHIICLRRTDIGTWNPTGFVIHEVVEAAFRMSIESTPVYEGVIHRVTPIKSA